MKNAEKWLQTSRLLAIYRCLSRGGVIHKTAEAKRFCVNERTIQRDIEDIRNFFAEIQSEGEEYKLIYSRDKKGYIMRQSGTQLIGSDTLAIVKVLLESRAFCRAELETLINKLIFQLLPEEKKRVQSIIANEQFHYVPVQHGKDLIDIIWCLSQAMKEQRLVRVTYKKENDNNPYIRILEPQGIIFSEYYFYLAACIHESCYDFPTIYRIDRIQDVTALEEGFAISYCNRFEEGEFRKRVQFMQSGPLLRIKFKYSGKSLEAVMDRLPTAKVIGSEENSTIVEAEVFGHGIKMWLLSQGEYLEVIEPEEFRGEIKQTIREMLGQYDKDIRLND